MPRPLSSAGTAALFFSFAAAILAFVALGLFLGVGALGGRRVPLVALAGIQASTEATQRIAGVMQMFAERNRFAFSRVERSEGPYIVLEREDGVEIDLTPIGNRRYELRVFSGRPRSPWRGLWGELIKVVRSQLAEGDAIAEAPAP
jgi:hypothetical protein